MHRAPHRWIQGFEELRAHLRTWREFEAPKLARARMLTASWNVVLIASWLATGMVEDIRLATAAGVVVIVTITMKLKGIMERKTLDNRYKASAALALGAFMLAPIARWVLYLVANASTSPAL